MPLFALVDGKALAINCDDPQARRPVRELEAVFLARGNAGKDSLSRSFDSPARRRGFHFKQDCELSLLARYGLTPTEIDDLSLKMVDDVLPPLPGLTPEECYVVKRIVRAEGEPEIANSVRFSPDAVSLGVSALKSGANIITDVRMVEVGTSRALLRKSGNPIATMIDAPRVAERAREEGITRSAAAMRELAPKINGAVVAIGNAPTALLALLDMVDENRVSPALVIGMPVGFVACAESKAELVERSVNHITILGNRGGSSAAAATLNALLTLATEGI
jgi:precorrin-8X/cobalt-precorrin-8 methylmutase